MKDSSVKRLGHIFSIQAKIDAMKQANTQSHSEGKPFVYSESDFMTESKRLAEICNMPDNEFVNKREKGKIPHQNKLDLGESIAVKIIKYYNTLNIMRSPLKDSVINDVENGYRALIKKGYTKEQIVESIHNYKEAYDSEWFFSTAWNIATFLRQKNACMSFCDGGERAEQYKLWKTQNNGMQSLPNEVQINNFISNDK